MGQAVVCCSSSKIVGMPLGLVNLIGDICVNAAPNVQSHLSNRIFNLSCYGQVLMIDSDNQPLTRPEDLFDLREYKANGAVFWPDYWTAGAALEVQPLCPASP